MVFPSLSFPSPFPPPSSLLPPPLFLKARAALLDIDVVLQSDWAERARKGGRIKRVFKTGWGFDMVVVRERKQRGHQGGTGDGTGGGTGGGDSSGGGYEGYEGSKVVVGLDGHPQMATVKGLDGYPQMDTVKAAVAGAVPGSSGEAPGKTLVTVTATTAGGVKPFKEPLKDPFERHRRGVWLLVRASAHRSLRNHAKQESDLLAAASVDPSSPMVIYTQGERR